MSGQPEYADAKDDKGDEDFEERERATVGADAVDDARGGVHAPDDTNPVATRRTRSSHCGTNCCRQYSSTHERSRIPTGDAVPRSADISAQLEYRNVAFPETVLVDVISPPTATFAASTVPLK